MNKQLFIKSLSGRRFIYFIFLLAFFIRLIPFMMNLHSVPGVFMEPDSLGYHKIAVNLLNGNGYSWDDSPPFKPNVYRPPGFPLLLFSVYTLFGSSIQIAIILIIFMSSITVSLTFILAKYLINERVAIASAFLFALDPISIQYSNLLLTETLTCFFITLAGIYLVRYLESKSISNVIYAGAVLGIGILFHPILILSPLVLLLFLAVKHTEQAARHHFAILVAISIVLCPASCWILRNKYVADFWGISNVTAVNILKYKAAGVMAELNGTTRELEAPRLQKECEAQLPQGLSDGKRWHAWQKYGLQIILDHPLLYSTLHVKGMFIELVGPSRDHTSRFLYGRYIKNGSVIIPDSLLYATMQRHNMPAYEIVRYIVLSWQGFLLLITLIGLILLIKRKNWIIIVTLTLPILYCLILSGGPEASPRFRVIFVSFLSIIAGYGASFIIPRTCGIGSYCPRNEN